MVLTFHAPRLPPLATLSRWTPVVLTWMFLLATAVFLGRALLDDGQPSPYGLCYESRGRPIPCELKKP